MNGLVLIHHGIKGQKWGIRRYQNLDGSLTENGKKRYRGEYRANDKVFISGKVSYDKPISDAIRKEVDQIVKARAHVLIGDAPGADTKVQEYLAKIGYKNVSVFTTDSEVRNNVGNWEVRKIDNNGEIDERAIRRQKDIAMTKESTKGFAIMPQDDRPDSAMSLNIQRMNEKGVPTRKYDYEQDRWF